MGYLKPVDYTNQNQFVNLTSQTFFSKVENNH